MVDDLLDDLFLFGDCRFSCILMLSLPPEWNSRLHAGIFVFHAHTWSSPSIGPTQIARTSLCRSGVSHLHLLPVLHPYSVALVGYYRLRHLRRVRGLVQGLGGDGPRPMYTLSHGLIAFASTTLPPLPTAFLFHIKHNLHAPHCVRPPHIARICNFCSHIASRAGERSPESAPDDVGWGEGYERDGVFFCELESR
jgi:hypothetical protein